MPRGLKSLIEAREGRRATEKTSSGMGQFIRDIRLYDKHDFAEIRFLTDYEDMYWDLAHRYDMYTPGGTRVWLVRTCAKASGQHCEHCTRNEKPRPFFWYWVHVYNLYYSRPLDGREQVAIGSMTKYRQEVNGPMVLVRPLSSHYPLETIIQAYGTLTDRDYKWIRQGERGDQKTTYALLPLGEPSDPPAVIAKYRNKLPDLEDVAAGRVEKIDLYGEPEVVRAEDTFDPDELEF